MKKAFGDNLIPDGWSLEKGLELIKKTGCDGVELWLGARPWFQMTTSDAGVQDLLRKVRDAGLAVTDVCNTMDWDENLSARDPKVLQTSVTARPVADFAEADLELRHRWVVIWNQLRAQPQLHAVAAGFLDQLQSLLETTHPESNYRRRLSS